jgi:WD40 repeat protein
VNLTKHWAATLDDYVIDLAWSADGALLAAASAAGPVSIFAANDGGRRQHLLEAHEQGTNAIAFAAGAGAPLATAGQDGTIKLWDATAGQHLKTAQAGPGWVEHLQWRPAGGRMLGAAASKRVLFVTAEGEVLKAAHETPKTVSALAWHPAGGALAVAYFGGVRLIDADDFIVQKELPYNNGIHALAWSPDGKWLVAGNQDPSVHLWIPEEDAELHMSGYETKVKHLSFDRSSRWLATSGGNDACIWDCSGAGPEGRTPSMLPHDSPVVAVAFQRQHGLLATAAQDGTVVLWSPERPQPLRATVKMPHPATKLCWSHDDALLAIGSEQGAVYVLRCDA